MTNRQHFTINGRLPGYNELTKGGWRANYIAKKKGLEQAGWSIKSAQIQPMTGKVEVTIRCYEPNSRRDCDNATSGASKIILDSLQNCGILKGDGQKYVKCIKHPVEVDRQAPRIEVLIRTDV